MYTRFHGLISNRSKPILIGSGPCFNRNLVGVPRTTRRSLATVDAKETGVRSSRLIPGNPWPHDMVIYVEDSADTLLELLWVREAWRLEPAGEDLPPRLID